MSGSCLTRAKEEVTDWGTESTLPCVCVCVLTFHTHKGSNKQMAVWERDLTQRVTVQLRCRKKRKKGDTVKSESDTDRFANGFLLRFVCHY